MDYLKLKGKTILIAGVANKKSIAYHVAQTLLECGAHLMLTVQNAETHARVEKLFPDVPLLICDAADSASIRALADSLQAHGVRLDGFLHSLAFARFEGGGRPFHETSAQDFLEAMRVSCFSLTEMAGALKPLLNPRASVVSVSISNTLATSYGYMGPIKACLETSIAYLAKSFSQFSEVRFNAVCSGPLKTSASAGLPGYVDNYLFAEKLTLRKRALETQEVADSICFLLSERSSGINATGLMIDAGMRVNYFDQDVVRSVTSGQSI